jgi:hypothetical protein
MDDVCIYSIIPTLTENAMSLIWRQSVLLLFPFLFRKHQKNREGKQLLLKGVLVVLTRRPKEKLLFFFLSRALVLKKTDILISNSRLTTNARTDFIKRNFTE